MKSEYKVQIVRKWNLKELNQVCSLLYLAGKDMAERYQLDHWNNSYFKDMVVVALCVLKNDMYLVYSDNIPVATFQLHKSEQSVCFQKLATHPGHMGKGIGSFCMNAIEEMAVRDGKSLVTCEVYDKSAHALEFYLHRGYEISGKTETLKYSEYKMQKRL